MGIPVLVRQSWEVRNVLLDLLSILCSCLVWMKPDLIVGYQDWPPQTAFFHSIYYILFCFLQASQLGVYRAFVDNYEVAMETAEKCCQANAQFAEISEVMSRCSDTRAAWLWLIPCHVTPVYSPSTSAALTSGGAVSSHRLPASARVLTLSCPQAGQTHLPTQGTW